MYRPRRNFDPRKTARYGKPTFEAVDLVKFSPKYQYSRLFNFPFRGSYWRPRMNTVVIQVQGIAKSNSSEDPTGTAAYGVSFGQGCSRNMNGLLDPALSQTQNRALLEAVRQALAAITAMRQNGELDPRWKEVIIMVDSEYIAKSLDAWIWTWVQKDYVTAKGMLVQHSDVFRVLQNTLVYMESSLLMSVRFWKVKREDIGEADLLAKNALEV